MPDATLHGPLMLVQVRTSEVPAVGGNVRLPWPFDSPNGFVGNDVEPDASEIVCFHATEVFSQGKHMEHSGHLHPEFGLLSPAPRLRRELRIAASSLLFGGIAGALCVSGVIALRHSDRASMEIAEAPTATASQTTASQEPRARMDARPAPRLTPPQPRGRKRPPTCPPIHRARHPRRLPPSLPRHAWCGSGKRSTVRRSRDFHWAAAKRPRRPHRGPTRPNRRKPRMPPPPAAMSLRPRRRKLASARAPGRPLPIHRRRRRRCRRRFAQPSLGATTSRAISSGVTSGQMTGALAPSLRSAPMSRAPRLTKLSPERAPGRVLSIRRRHKTVRNASSRRNDAGNDSFWRDERQDDWNARAAAANDARNPVGRANAREAASSFRGFWDWSR